MEHCGRGGIIKDLASWVLGIIYPVLRPFKLEQELLVIGQSFRVGVIMSLPQRQMEQYGLGGIAVAGNLEMALPIVGLLSSHQLK